jgi:hypothetical protein
VPAGASIVSGQGSNSIVVNFGVSSGFITLQEVTGAGCINDIASLYISVVYTVSVSQTAYLTCHGSATATLSVTATGGTSPYTYSWSPSGGTASTASGLAAGAYTVTVTDNASVVVTSSSFLVSQPPLITGSQTISLCAGQTTTVGPHSYNTTNTYIDTLTATNGCDSILTTHLTVNPLSTVSLSIAGNDSLCSFDGAFVLSGGNPAGGIYSGTGVGSGSFNPTTANAAWNVITYTVIDGNNCSNKAKDSLYIKTCLGTGLSDFDISKVLLVYPNPAFDVVVVSVNGVFEIEVNIYNSIGELILAKQFNTNVATMDIHYLTRGLYLLKVKTEQGMAIHRIIKE